jgi:hypothetical protein
MMLQACCWLQHALPAERKDVERREQSVSEVAWGASIQQLLKTGQLGRQVS